MDGYDNNNNDDDNNKAMDDADMESKATRKTAWDMMWDNRGPKGWALDYKKQYDMKYTEWHFDAVPQMMKKMNVSEYVDLDIELKLRELEEEEAQ